MTVDASLNEVRLLSKLVTDFLNFSRPQQLNLVRIDMRSMIDNSVEEVKAHITDPEVRFSVEGQFGVLPGDETLLQRAFINLVRNAAEAIEPSSIEKRITISGSVDTGPERRYAHIRVADTGSGIALEDLNRIFIPFFTTKSRGYGIGLALVQKILVAHGGDVAVERSDSSGTMFHCRLPLMSPANMEER
jgi:signal transduction histidine kinase